MEENKTKMGERFDRYWRIVENALNDGSKYGYKIAIVDTEKILILALREKNIPGDSLDEKVEFVRKMLANPDKLRYSRAMYKKILEEIGFDVSLEDTKEIIAGYYKAISDITEMNYYKVSWKDRVRLIKEKYSKKMPLAAKNLLIAIFLSFTAIFITSETDWGRNLTTALQDISKFIFYKLIPATLVLLAAIFVILIVLSLIRKRKNRNNLT